MTTIVLAMSSGNAVTRDLHTMTALIARQEVEIDAPVLILLLLIAGMYLLVTAVRGLSRSIGLAGRLLGTAARAGIAFVLIAGAATAILLALILRF